MVPWQLLLLELVSNEIQNGGGRDIEITFLAITRPLMHIFALNTIYRGRKKGSERQSSYENSDVPKSKMALVAFWNQLNSNNSPNIEWIHTKFDTETDNQVSVDTVSR